MGLAAAKNKRRLGNDPNNTKWSRNTDSFGQRMLRSQGWEPGQYLGAKDAAHAEWHTEANSSHIRVVLKDDTLGLGAKRNTGDECTGLNAFQNLLGRLNGKSEDVIEAEEQARMDVKRNLYVEQKIGVIRFVKGGWLVGDVVKEKLAEEDEGFQTESKQDSAVTSSVEEATKAEKKSKKRKAEKESDESIEKTSKKDKKSKKRKSEDDSDSDDSRAKKKSKKSKKRKAEEDAEMASDSEEATTSAVESKKSRKEKKEKKKSKEEKKAKKEKRRKEKASSSGSGTETGDSISREKKRRKAEVTEETSELPAPAPQPSASGTSTPVGSGYSTPTISNSTSTRYLSRKRFIAQKTMAFSDATALNQIFMIKS
ncbi:Protein PXR1 [Naviculisporaceae sp. PSN 640]